MSKIYVSHRAQPVLITWLQNAGHTVVLCGTGTPLSVDPAICHHPDLLHCSLGPSRPVFHGAASRLGERYPADAIYNACCTGRYFIHKLKCTDPQLLDLAKSAGLTLIDVPQGYTRCSCLPVNENSIITADQGILRACRRAGLQCLEAGPGFVRLPGYPYGFLGGAAGRVGNTILFHGNLDAHPDGPRIRAFIEERGLRCVDFEEFPLTDIGSVIEEPLTESENAQESI
ncbi:MAG: hypothetical protein PUE84_00895 [Firmicutes bacterium]|nr:hypothetical protein [Bacillota bacterium]